MCSIGAVFERLYAKSTDWNQSIQVTLGLGSEIGCAAGSMRARRKNIVYSPQEKRLCSDSKKNETVRIDCHLINQAIVLSPYELVPFREMFLYLQ